MIHNRVTEFEVNGVKRGLKFGTYAIGVACRQEGCDINELFMRCGLMGDPKLGTRTITIEGEEKEVPVMRNTDIISLTSLLYGAAVSYCVSKKTEPDFDAPDVADWLDTIGIEKARQVIFGHITPYQAKNSEAPQEVAGQ